MQSLKFSENQVTTLHVLWGCLKSNRMRFPTLVLSQLGSTIFEGITIFLILLAAQLLIEGSITSLGVLPMSVQSLVAQFTLVEAAIMLIVLAIVGQLVKSSFEAITVVLAAKLKARSAHFLYKAVISNIMTLAYPTITKMKVGALNEGLNQTEKLAQLMIFVTLNRGLNALLMLTGYILFMLIVSPVLTLAAMIALSVIILPAILLSRQLHELGRRYAEDSLSLGGIAIQYLSSPRLIRLFGRTGSTVNEMSEAKKQILGKVEQGDVLTGIVDPIFKGIFNIGIGLVLLIGALSGKQPIQEVAPMIVTFIIIAGRMQGSFSVLNQARMRLINSLGLLEQVGRLLQPDTLEVRGQAAIEISSIDTDIVFDDVSFCYDSRVEPIIDSVSLTISRGRSIGITGPSGSGKTTLIDLLLGLYEVDSGGILVNGSDLKKISQESWLSRIGVVDQQPFLFNGSIRENIVFGAKGATDSEICEAATHARAHEFIERLPDGYDTLVGDRGVLLSGGQVQRVAIARALIRKPELIIFDEATSALDTNSERLIQEAIDAQRGKATIIIIAHRLSTLLSTDEIAVLDNGRIVELGAPQELIDQSGLFHKMWKTQADVGIDDSLG